MGRVFYNALYCVPRWHLITLRTSCLFLGQRPKISAPGHFGAKNKYSLGAYATSTLVDQNDVAHISIAKPPKFNLFWTTAVDSTNQKPRIVLLTTQRARAMARAYQLHDTHTNVMAILQGCAGTGGLGADLGLPKKIRLQGDPIVLRRRRTIHRHAENKAADSKTVREERPSERYGGEEYYAMVFVDSCGGA